MYNYPQDTSDGQQQVTTAQSHPAAQMSQRQRKAEGTGRYLEVWMRIRTDETVMTYCFLGARKISTGWTEDTWCYRASQWPSGTISRTWIWPGDRWCVPLPISCLPLNYALCGLFITRNLMQPNTAVLPSAFTKVIMFSFSSFYLSPRSLQPYNVFLLWLFHITSKLKEKSVICLL